MHFINLGSFKISLENFGPMQYGSAAKLAKKEGCRLPTIKEFIFLNLIQDLGAGNFKSRDNYKPTERFLKSYKEAYPNETWDDYYYWSSDIYYGKGTRQAWDFKRRELFPYLEDFLDEDVPITRQLLVKLVKDII
jgi:hypothetical protein